jgi:RimJ/RimL family protein N-acetyltransferase
MLAKDGIDPWALATSQLRILCNRRKSLNRVIGIAGLDYPTDWPEPEIQWGLAKNFGGKGYASEAIRAIKEMTKRFIPEISLISLIHPDNSNSSILAKAVGAYFEKEYFFRNGIWHI